LAAVCVAFGSFAAGHTVSISSSTGVSCFGTCDGSATASVSGGIGPFSYSWSPAGGSSATASGLCAGTYTVTVTDMSDMSTATVGVTISSPAALAVSATGGVVCAGSCTTLSFTATGGVLPYIYSWSGGSSTVCPASTTTYTVTIVDANGCTANGPATVTVNPVPAVVSEPSIAACQGNVIAANSFASSPAGATFSWTNSNTAIGLPASGAAGLPAFTAGSPGTATITITASLSGCTSPPSTFTITVNPVPVVTVNSATICSGSVAHLTVSGAVTYSWTVIPSLTVTGAATADANPTTMTSYTVSGTSGVGCVNTAISTVTVNPGVVATATPYSTVCAGSCVTLSSAYSGGTGAVIYSWSPATGLSSSTTPTPMSCPAVTTSYVLTVTDAAGCSGTATSIVNVDNLYSTGTATSNATGCGVCDGSATLTPAGGSAPYSYVWSNGATTAVANAVCGGSYSVTITDVNGCTLTDIVTVIENLGTHANFTMVPDSTNAYNFYAFNSSDGPGLSYAWNFGDGVSSSAASPSHLYVLPGTYNVCLTATGSCGASTLCEDVDVTGTLASCMSLFNIADDTTNVDPNSHYVYNLSYGAGLTYSWDFGDGGTSTLMTPTHIYSGTGPYEICLTVDNGSGCIDVYCDSLISADSINRSSGTIQFAAYDVGPFGSGTTGIHDPAANVSISASPNPFSDHVTFNITSERKNEVYQFELFDVLGKSVKAMDAITRKKFSMNRDGLPEGVYFYKISTIEGVMGVGKLVLRN
jgi:large repetitive protein